MCIAQGTGPFNTDDCVQCPVCCLIICAKSSAGAAQIEATAAALPEDQKAAVKATIQQAAQTRRSEA